jgi:hypothetical protein
MSSIIPLNAPEINETSEYVLFDNSKYSGLQSSSSLCEPENYVLDKTIGNGFISAIHNSFAKHIPIKFKPDDIWQVFLGQISLLINKNPEKYRHVFVNHNNKKKIEIRCDSLVKDSLEDAKEWQYVFSVFEKKLDEDMKIKMSTKFTTTNINDSIVSQIMIMDCMNNYYDYEVHTKCGIPKVIIDGEIQDWELLGNKIKEICGACYVDEWVCGFENFINQSIMAIKGKGDPSYWEKLYHYEGRNGSGTTNIITGLVNQLFPVDINGNVYIYEDNKERNYNSYPELKSVVPFIWHYYSDNIYCNFHAGLTHTGYNPELNYVYPKSTWLILIK